MSTDQDVLIGRIIQRWQHRTVPAAYDTPVLQQMAADAITALNICGSPHPNRPAVVCTDDPDHFPDWHRNAALGLEWSPDGHWTVHDELGPVTLVQQPPPPGPGRYVGLDRPVTIDPRDFQVGGVGPGNDPTPQPYCPAHGDTACTWCAQTTPGGLTDGGCRGCEYYALTGMHWDTCPHRVPTAPPIPVDPDTDPPLDEIPADLNVVYLANGERCTRGLPDGTDRWVRYVALPERDFLNEYGPVWATPGGDHRTAIADDMADREADVAAGVDALTMADAAWAAQNAIHRHTITVLDAAAGKLHRMLAHYKGSPTKGAAKVADQCEVAAEALRGLLDAWGDDDTETVDA